MSIRVCVAVLLLLPGAAFAQGNPGPFGGLFGRTPERLGREFTALDFRTALAGQYDDALFTDDVLPEGEVPQSGLTGGANANLAFERQTDRLLVSAQGGASYQEFYRETTFGATTYNGSVRARGQATSRLQLDGTARYLRSPFFRLVPNYQALAPAVPIPGDPYFARLLINDAYDVTGGFTSRYSKSSAITASVSHRVSRFLSGTGNTYEVLRADGRWTRQLSRNLALRAGYGREHITQSAFQDAEYIYELIDLGVDYSKQLSIGERTSIGFSTQTSVVKRPTTGRRYRMNGSVSFSKFFGRTGHASASLSRYTEFLPGFLEPLNADALTGAVSGMLSKRTEWMTTLSIGKGRFGYDTPDDFLNGTFTSRVNFALTRRFGIYGQYAAYYYKLPPTPTSMILLGEVSRQSVSVGINTWVPVINKVRVPRDPE